MEKGEGGAVPLPHALLVPFPVQSHVNPMMHIAQRLSSYGFIVTFVSSEYNLSRALKGKDLAGVRVRAIPDGLADGDNRNDFRKLAEITERTMPKHLRETIADINETERNPVTCVVGDFFASWSLDVAHELEISQTAAFWPGLIAAYALIRHLPELLSSAVLPADGIPREKKLMKYLPSMPEVSSARLPWMIGTEEDMKFRFQFWKRSETRLKKARFVLFNSFEDLERPILNTFGEDPTICPVGPLLHTQQRLRTDLSSEDCLNWLDRQEPRSVVYVSFGSSIWFGEAQVTEIAIALERSASPFLWVVRHDCNGMAMFPSGFLERTKGEGRGCFVAWAPQTEVLSHKSVGCFVSHCGWNSVIESIYGGTPLLCLPHVADQFLNASYVVESWGIGLRLGSLLKDHTIVGNLEIMACLSRMMFGDEASEIRQRTDKLKETALAARESEGSSSINFRRLVSYLIKEIHAPRLDVETAASHSPDIPTLNAG